MTPDAAAQIAIDDALFEQLRDAANAYGVYALGAALLISLSVRSWRTRLTLSILAAGFADALFLASADSALLGEAAWWLAGGFLLAGILTAVVIGGWFWSPVRWSGGQRLRAFLAARTSPERWSPGAMPLPTRDLVTRWFVTVAAASAGGAFYLVGTGEFWHAVAETFAPHRLLGDIIIVVVPLVLIGPVEEFVFRTRAHEGGGDPTEREAIFLSVFHAFSWRALGRLVVVMLLVSALNVLHTSFDEAVHASELDTFNLMHAALAPAIMAFYWSAALQHGEIALTRRVLAGAFWTRLVLEGARLIVLAIGLAVLWYNNPTGDPVDRWAHFIGLAGAGVPFILATAASAWLGGVFLEGARKRPGQPLLLLFAQLAVAVMAPMLLVRLAVIGLLALNRPEWRDFAVVAANTAPFILSGVGAAVGLAVSGFPHIVAHAKRAAGPSAALPA